MNPKTTGAVVKHLVLTSATGLLNARQIQWARARGDGSVSKVFIVKARGPEQESQHPHRKPRVMMRSQNPRTGDGETVGPWDSDSMGR